MKSVYAEFDLDWQEVTDALVDVFTDDERRREMQESTNIFRVLIKTLLRSGIITDRTRGYYAAYVDMDELTAEEGDMVGYAIADDGIKFLKTINFGANASYLSSAAE